MNRDDALQRAIGNAETAERLLSIDEELTGPVPGGPARNADQGPYGEFERQRQARISAAAAHATLARAWAAVAEQLPSPGEARERAALERQREVSDRRSRA